jgi:hypothetical protein
MSAICTAKAVVEPMGACVCGNARACVCACACALARSCRRTLLPLPRARKTYNIDVKPIAALAHCLCALMAELGKVGAQDRGRYDRGRAHRGV